jgi:hypothetical protein
MPHRVVVSHARYPSMSIRPHKAALTIGAIARELGEPVHRVQYVVKTRAIEPEAMAGNLRIFPPEAVERVADILRAIDYETDRRVGGVA